MKRILAIAAVIVIGIAASAALTLLAIDEVGLNELHRFIPVNAEKPEAGSGSPSIDWSGYPSEIVAWVGIPGSSVDEPVAQASEYAPDAYLTVDPTGRGGYGVPYLDWECGSHSAFAVIYGHHMDDGSMFADLAKFSDPDYAKEHRLIELYTRDDGQMHVYEIVSVDVVNAWNETIRVGFEDEDDRFAYLSSAIEKSDVVIGEIAPEDRILALVTCSYQTSNSRTVVYAREIVAS